MITREEVLALKLGIGNGNKKYTEEEVGTAITDLTNEIRDFENRNRVGNKVTITRNSIKNEEDYHNLTDLIFMVKEDTYHYFHENYAVGELVKVHSEDGKTIFEFNKFSYDRY